MQLLWFRVMALGAGLAAGAPGLADVLTTRSGETLIGTVVEERADEIVFDSDAFGRLIVKRGLILSLERSGAPSAAPEQTPAAEAEPASAPAAGTTATTTSICASAPSAPPRPATTTACRRATTTPRTWWPTASGSGPTTSSPPITATAIA